MTNRSSFVLAIFAILMLVALSPAALGQSSENSLANVSSIGSGVRFDVTAAHGSASLTVTAPDGRAFTKEFRGGAEFTVGDKSFPDGVYTYELRLRPMQTAAQRESLKTGRGTDDEPEADRAARKRQSVANMVQSGSFALVNGQVIVAGLSEGGKTAKSSTQPGRLESSGPARVASGNTTGRLLNHRMSLLSNYMFDQVIPDDLIVQGSICAGLDCVNNESFSFDTIRTKENNVRISFNDTSTSAGFPTNDWTIRANASGSGGGNFLAFVDRGANNPGDETGTIVLEVDAGAPANSVRVDSTGRLGLRTATPVLDVHVNTSNTPAMRYEQNNSGGFTAQTWDIGANEANFFVRDVTGGSRLPFRIRPGAPTSSIDIAASGRVGVGTASPTTDLDVTHNQNATTAIAVINTDTNASARSQLTLNTAAVAARVLTIANDAMYIGTTSSNPVNFQTGGSNAMSIDTAQRIGIGTTAPDQKLSVNGDANKSLGGGSWGVFSDERLKDIKGNFTRGLSAVMGLRPLRFSYKKDNAMALNSDGENVGFSAQEVQRLVPEAVTTNGAGYLMVHNDAILWTMLNAIKEQQKEIEQLKGQIRKLQSTAHRRRR